MTSAPATLRDARAYLLSVFDVHPGATTGADLDPAEVGIVADAAHRGGYHCGADRVINGDYSVTESGRDRNGLTDYAAALDIGRFSKTFPNGTTVDLPHLSNWLVGQCKAGSGDTLDIREIIYSPDGKGVKRWDRLGRRSTGDSSHLFHTHISEFRDASKAGRRNLLALVRRYVTTFSGTSPPLGGTEMDPNGKDIHPELTNRQVFRDIWDWVSGDRQPGHPAKDASRFQFPVPREEVLLELRTARAEAATGRAAVTALAAQIEAGGGNVDTTALLARINELAREAVARDSASQHRQQTSAQAVADALGDGA